MAHEFAHGLGLPDLYDLLYDTPEKDSAGIGAWGLMGMGTLGWSGNDGPNPLSAWSRAQVGWLGRDNQGLVEIRGDTTDLLITDLHQKGAVYKVPLRHRFMASSLVVEEYLLLEYRAAKAHHYNRNHPADGLLVWHVRSSFENNLVEATKMVDLVCADGLYTDAGFPEGNRTDPRTGMDNLDFWAHDRAYARAHNGNAGDATDPFDGQTYTRLDLGSNPSADLGAYLPATSTGLSLRIRRQGDGVRVDIVRPRWSGTINGEFHLLDQIIVDGDLTVAPGAKLVVYPTGGIRFAASDRLQSGLDPQLCELHVEGPPANRRPNAQTQIQPLELEAPRIGAGPTRTFPIAAAGDALVRNRRR